MQRGWAVGWEELEETASVVMPKCLGAGGGLGQGREQEKSSDAGGPPLLGLPGLGDCHLRSMLSVCSPGHCTESLAWWGERQEVSTLVMAP